MVFIMGHGFQFANGQITRREMSFRRMISSDQPSVIRQLPKTHFYDPFFNGWSLELWNKTYTKNIQKWHLRFSERPNFSYPINTSAVSDRSWNLTTRAVSEHFAPPQGAEDFAPTGQMDEWIDRHSHGKSPFIIGKPSINGPFSMAMLNSQRVSIHE